MTLANLKFILVFAAAGWMAGCAPQEAGNGPFASTQADPPASDQVYARPIVESPQLTPNWCWAACFEMALRSSGVQTTQPTVVRVLKGAVVNAKISVPELIRGFNSRGITVNYVAGKPTRDRLTSFLSSSPPDARNFIIERRKNGTPDWHAVMVWGYDILPDGRLFVYMYDPLTNRDSSIWYAYDEAWEGTFFVTVNKTVASIYWAESAQANIAHY